MQNQGLSEEVRRLSYVACVPQATAMYRNGAKDLR